MVSQEVRQHLVSALILSRIDYCNFIFVGLPDVTLAPLRRVMNTAMCSVAGLGPRDHVTAEWRDLHWLPIEQRITYKLCIMMHAINNGTAPKYICDLATPVNEIRGRSHLRSATLGHFNIPRTRTRLGSRAFSVAVQTAWNNLTASIRSLKSTDSFKRQLKTHLFRLAY